MIVEDPNRMLSKTLDAAAATTLPPEILDMLDSNDPFDSFNITMMEERIKINEHAKGMGFRTPS